jgi:hypothetical protein
MDVALALNNNHSLILMIIYNRCWVSAKQQSFTHSTIIYNRCWVGAKQQSLTQSNDYLQQMLNWCLTTIIHIMSIYNGCWGGAKQK